MFFGNTKKKSENRIPPGQHIVKGWPVLHAGQVPQYPNLNDWNLKIEGCVQYPLTFTFQDIYEMPVSTVENDVHCVTGWSKLDMKWGGVRAKDLVLKAEIQPEARFVLLHAEEGWTTNLPVADFLKDTTLLAYTYEGRKLEPEHGYPLRAVVPHLYFWKSAKWLRKIEFSPYDVPGFWERNGYHNYGNPWRSERTSWDLSSPD